MVAGFDPKIVDSCEFLHGMELQDGGMHKGAKHCGWGPRVDKILKHVSPAA
jgi:hypothetical protein